MSTEVTRVGAEPRYDIEDPRTKFDRERQAVFLECFSKTGRHEESALAAGVSYETMRVWRKTDPDFAASFQAADRRYREKLRREIERRGVEGWLEPVFSGGQQVMEAVLDEQGEALRDEAGNLRLRPAKVRKFSDRLLELLAKRQDPEFRERLDVTASTDPDAGGSKASSAEVRRELERLSPEARDRLRLVLEELAGSRARPALAQGSTEGTRPSAPEREEVIDVDPVGEGQGPS